MKKLVIAKHLAVNYQSTKAGRFVNYVWRIVNRIVNWKEHMKHDVLFSHNSDEWETPQGFFDELNGRYHFELDVCATDGNRKCLRYFTKQDDGLSRKWGGRVWCNPPYSDITSWVRKAHEEVSSGRCEVVVMLVPARTDTRWFHDWCYNKRGVQIKFVKGRLKFGGAKHNAPFPSMVVVFRRENTHEESA